MILSLLIVVEIGMKGLRTAQPFDPPHHAARSFSPVTSPSEIHPGYPGLAAAALRSRNSSNHHATPSERSVKTKQCGDPYLIKSADLREEISFHS